MVKGSDEDEATASRRGLGRFLILLIDLSNEGIERRDEKMVESAVAPDSRLIDMTRPERI